MSPDGPSFVTVGPELAAEHSALAAPLDEGLLVMTHVPDRCACDGTRRLTAACVQATASGPGRNDQQLSWPRERIQVLVQG